MSEENKYKAVGDRLRRVRLALHGDLSIKEFAKFIDVNYTRYLNWESGLYRPRPEEAEIMCDKLGITLDFIYRGIDFALAQNTAKALSGIPTESQTSTSSDMPD